MPNSVYIYRNWCKKCGICVEFCPKGVFHQETTGEVTVKNPENCIKCKFCELRCPDFAITVPESEKDDAG
ncbi:MAG: 4Fe-4S binding protein [Candidatus Wallbacteria bacterium]|nr:4Fe-4S binding protein [Candidatus Wallbacteria bacterium]